MRPTIMKKVIVFLLSIIICFSCERRSFVSLHTAETLLGTHPDSALSVLRSVDKASLKSRSMEAKYALLMSAALDKNYIDIASDSLISRAVDYYSKQGRPRDKMLAWYYQGICLKNAGYMIPAMLAFEKAEREAVQLEEWLYLGLIYRNKAVLFNKSCNIATAIEYWNKAISCFEKAEAGAYKAYAELSLATDYSNEKEYEKADSLIKQLEAAFPDNPNIRVYCSLRKAEIIVQKENEMEKAIDLFRSIPRNRLGILDYGYVAHAFESMGVKDSADFWLSEGYRLCSDESEVASLDYRRSFIEKHRGNDDSAFHLIDRAASVQDSVTRTLLQQSVTGALVDYYKSESSAQEKRIRMMRERTLFGIAFGLLAAAVLLMALIYASQKKDRLLQEHMARLTLNEHELNRIRKENASLIGSLFSEKVGHLDNLCESYFRLEDGRQKELVLRQVKELSTKMRNDDGLFLSLEKDLNRYCQDIMKKLHDQVPRIKGENRRIIMLFFAGFSYEMVYIIMNKNSVESLKTVRSRFRKEIQESQAPDSALFLKMLEMKKRPQTGANE